MDFDNQIGAYRIVRLIQRGGQGSVYLGYDTLLERRVAIKIYDLPARRSERKPLVAEAQLVASLDSPKIVPVHDVIESDSHLAMVLAYVPGCSLEEFLTRCRPSVDSLITVGTDIAGALAIARQSRIVHGDVKPANVLLTADGHAKLTDFGIARDVRGTDLPGHSGGSFWSLTPEHLREEEITQQADIFALGVLLYRMMCLEHPFAVDGRLDTHRMLHASPVPLRSRIPPESEVPDILVDIIDHMLHKDPRQRPKNTRGIRQVLRDVSRDIPMSVGSALLRESKPFFRAESAEDVPLQIPRELARSGRSRKKAPIGIAQSIGYWFTGLSKSARLLLGGFFVAAGLLAALYLRESQPTRVSFSAPVTDISDSWRLPDEISKGWLVNELRAVVEEELGNIIVVSSVGAKAPPTLYSPSAKPPFPVPPEEQFDIVMRCDASLCLVSIGRDGSLKRRTERAVVFQDAPLAQWREAVRGAARAVFR